MLAHLTTETFVGCPTNVPVFLRHLQQEVEREAVDGDIPVRTNDLGLGAEGDVMVRMGERHVDWFGDSGSTRFYARGTTPYQPMGSYPLDKDKGPFIFVLSTNHRTTMRMQHCFALHRTASPSNLRSLTHHEFERTHYDSW
jgi:hypothetical protein